MHLTTSPSPRSGSVRSGLAALVSPALAGFLVALTVISGESADVVRSAPSADCCADDPTTAESRSVPTALDASSGPADPSGSAGPDRVADDIGGIAARVRAGDGTPLSGDVFVLMGSSGSTKKSRVYDETPFTSFDGSHPETLAANVTAAETVETITGREVELLELTGAPGGGRSGGVAYAISYLDVVSDGAFSGGRRIAATGRLGAQGQISPISHVDVKTAAAHLADVDVLFTSTSPTAAVRDAYGARLIGDLDGDPRIGGALNAPDRLDAFRSWGADRPEGMDIVNVRHLIDVAAYLCGDGSAHACHVTAALDEQARRRLDQLQAEAASEADRLRARRPSGVDTSEG